MAGKARQGGTSTGRILIASLVGTGSSSTISTSTRPPPRWCSDRCSSRPSLARRSCCCAYATFGLAFVARPLGASLFGHFGDRIGRKSTLVASLLLMGGSTLLIAFLPTYAQAGWVAPLLLCVLRFGQGFGLGGEWGGAALLAVENAPPGWRARFGMFPQLGAPVGFIAANGLFLMLGLALTPRSFVTGAGGCRSCLAPCWSASACGCG